MSGREWQFIKVSNIRPYPSEINFSLTSFRIASLYLFEIKIFFPYLPSNFSKCILCFSSNTQLIKLAFLQNPFRHCSNMGPPNYDNGLWRDLFCIFSNQISTFYL